MDREEALYFAMKTLISRYNNKQNRKNAPEDAGKEEFVAFTVLANLWQELYPEAAIKRGLSEVAATK